MTPTRADRVAHLGAIALVISTICAKLPAPAPTAGGLRAAAAVKRGPDVPDVLARVPLVRVESGAVTVDEVSRVAEPVQVDGPVDVEAAGALLPVHVER